MPLYAHLLPGPATHLHRLLGDGQLCGLRLHRRRFRDRLRSLDSLFGLRFSSQLPLCPPLRLATPPGRFAHLSPLYPTTPLIWGPSTFETPHNKPIERARCSGGHEAPPRFCRVTQGGPSALVELQPELFLATS